MGKCPDCGQWDVFSEEAASGKLSGSRASSLSGALSGSISTAGPALLESIEMTDHKRLLTGMEELDRVLGGGLTPGSVALIGGDPGIGKSTIMLQALDGLSRKGLKTLYVSGEESPRQIRIRSERLFDTPPGLLVVSENSVEAILVMMENLKPDALVIDSIQTMFSADLTSAPGSVTQVRESTMRLMMAAKKTGAPMFLVGHVTKDGAIAGPRVMEHMVDTVLYFEGDGNHMFRILRAVKNRFGSTNEIGVFEMKGKGLVQVPNPSSIFISGRPENVPGSVVTASMGGSRPILVELQALVCASNLGTPRRTILGLDPNRVALLAAVMERKMGLALAGHDIFLNVTGGVKIDEPAADMGIVAAIASSFLDKPAPPGAAIFGEVGLTGEIRGVSRMERRIMEAKKMGFTQCLTPYGSHKRMGKIDGIKIIGVRNLAEAAEALF
ncbi:DNA repair protein RadA [Candidatus Desulfarcum epimagneticum]|uniref:DNA repair protein RadA n=1 Tax=uncultured Desulfobacteraceae bacterium TaxID=218296 RepID=A0A484HFT1_9BACT|nr:DNA repair protein RadA [uncultured Desulfobacteraceae bacterium]